MTDNTMTDKEIAEAIYQDIREGLRRAGLDMDWFDRVNRLPQWQEGPDGITALAPGTTLFVVTERGPQVAIVGDPDVWCDVGDHVLVQCLDGDEYGLTVRGENILFWCLTPTEQEKVDE